MSNIKTVILNIAAGKVTPTWLEDYDIFFLVNLDPMYKQHFVLESDQIDSEFRDWNIFKEPKKVLYCNDSWEKFLPSCLIEFDVIVVWRFLEHVQMTNVPFFIYSLSTCLKVGGIVDVIVPNYETLARRILTEDPFVPDFESQNILTTTELLNEPYDPHASIWTLKRIRYFFQLEGRFEIKLIQERFEFEGRDIYIHFIAKKVK